MPYQQDLRQQLTQIQDMGTSATGFAKQITDVKVQKKAEEEAKAIADAKAKADAAWQKKQAAALAESQKKQQRETIKQTKQIAELTRRNTELARKTALSQKTPAQSDSLGGLTGPSAGKAKGILGVAASLKGIPYKWGGNTPQSGLDCSGYTKLVFARNGITIPRTSREQRKATPNVPASQARPGDLVFFAKNGVVHHVGIYAGNGKMWNSPHTGSHVKLQSVWRSSGDVVSYGRVPQAQSKLKSKSVNAYGLAILSKMGNK